MPFNRAFKQAQESLLRIKDHSDKENNEAAHMVEDNLHQYVLRVIAKNCDGDVGQLAKLALSTKKIKFARWYS